MPMPLGRWPKASARVNLIRPLFTTVSKAFAPAIKAMSFFPTLFIVAHSEQIELPAGRMKVVLWGSDGSKHRVADKAGR